MDIKVLSREDQKVYELLDKAGLLSITENEEDVCLQCGYDENINNSCINCGARLGCLD